MSTRYAAEVKNIVRDDNGVIRTVEVSVYGELPGCHPSRGLVRNVSQYTKQTLISVAVDASRPYGVSEKTLADLHYNVSVCDGQDCHRVIFRFAR